MHFPKSTVGKKILMAITGLMLLTFVLLHLLGNTSVFLGPGGINAYSAKLRNLAPFLWVFRVVMALLFYFHVFFGIQLTLENRSAKPRSYAVNKSLSSTFSSKNMIWTGLLLAVFIGFHLLHFTFHIITPEITSANTDAMGRPDVFRMMVLSFQDLFIFLIYLGAMIVLALHLAHGIQSMFQTIGINNDRTLPVITKGGRFAALVLSLGYMSIPVVIILGILKL